METCSVEKRVLAFDCDFLLRLDEQIAIFTWSNNVENNHALFDSSSPGPDKHFEKHVFPHAFQLETVIVMAIYVQMALFWPIRSHSLFWLKPFLHHLNGFSFNSSALAQYYCYSNVFATMQLFN